jgi:hypothetical protein
MSNSDKVLIGIFISVAAWLITNVVMFVLKRYRLQCAIASDISYHILGVREAKDYLDKLFQNVIRVDHSLDMLHTIRRTNMSCISACSKI